MLTWGRGNLSIPHPPPPDFLECGLYRKPHRRGLAEIQIPGHHAGISVLDKLSAWRCPHRHLDALTYSLSALSFHPSRYPSDELLVYPPQDPGPLLRLSSQAASHPTSLGPKLLSLPVLTPISLIPVASWAGC